MAASIVDVDASPPQQMLTEKFEASAVDVFDNFRIAAAQTVFAVRHGQHDVGN